MPPKAEAGAPWPHYVSAALLLLFVLTAVFRVALLGVQATVSVRMSTLMGPH